MQNVPFSRQRGFTLIELVVVVGVIAIIAAIAYPSLSSNDSRELDAAAAKFAAAIRFARSESIRTGKPHGFRVFISSNRITVFSVDTSGSPWTSINDVYHPVDKNLYEFFFPAELAGSVPPIDLTPVYRGNCDRSRIVYFNIHGTPWCIEPETVLLDSYRVDLSTDTASAAILLDGITGRVTVQ